MKKLIILLVGLGLFTLSCSTDQDEINEQITADAKVNANNAFVKFKVTIENIGSDQEVPVILSPGVYLVQKKESMPLFTEGEADYGEGLEAIAEDGMPGTLAASLQNDPKVRKHDAFAVPVGGSGPAPIFAGGAYEFYVTAKPNDFLNFATMYVQSNDLFIAPGQYGIPLFNENGEAISGDISMYLELWDAGTEINEEPGVGMYQAPRQSGPDSGPTENGLVRPVEDGYTYPDVQDIVRVSITPME